MEGGANYLMDTDVAGEDHVAIIRILGSKAPDIVQLARPAPFLWKAADGSIVTGKVASALVFTFAGLTVLVEQIFSFHRRDRLADNGIKIVSLLKAGIHIDYNRTLLQ